MRAHAWKKSYCWAIVLIPALYFIGTYSYIRNEQNIKVGGILISVLN